jgi:hypothetical protein
MSGKRGIFGDAIVGNAGILGEAISGNGGIFGDAMGGNGGIFGDGIEALCSESNVYGSAGLTAPVFPAGTSAVFAGFCCACA